MKGQPWEEATKIKKEASVKTDRGAVVSTVLYVLGGILGIVVILCLIWSINVPATKVGVVENKINGKLYMIEPGWHVWPFDSAAVPLVTSSAVYDLRMQIIEIGAAPAREKGVQAASASPGKPNVYFYARGWAYPNKGAILELHRKYGPKYLDNWVEGRWVSVLKGTQGKLEYDFVGLKRDELEKSVEDNLQAQLLGDDGVPLVFVSQLAIVDYGYDKAVDQYLDDVASKQFEIQVAVQQALVNTKQQEAAKIEAETAFITKKRGAEADAVQQQVGADAKAYEIKVVAEAQAEAVHIMQQAMASASSNVLNYFWVQKWNGTLPQYNMGNSVPLVGIPTQ